MIALSSRPKLAAKARLREDKKTGGLLLVFPEAGLKLNATAAALLQRCDGVRTLDAIVNDLVTTFPDGDRSTIERDAQVLLQRLIDRSLVVL